MTEQKEAIKLPTTIDEALEFDFTGWNPQPGAKVSGTIVSKSESSEGTYGTYPILNVITFDGEGVALHCFHEQLRRMAETAEAGDEVGVKYKGTKTAAASGNEYADYNVILRHTAPALPSGE